MTTRKISLFAFVSALALIPALFFTCEKVPDYCSSGEVYDPTCQFCFGGAAHNLCGGKKYNPLTEGCAQNAVGTRCQDETAVPLGTKCGGYALSTASAPASGGDVTRTPDKPNYAAKERVVLNADPKDGYEFVGWAGANTSTARTVTITMNDNAPLVAMFKPIDLPGAAAHTLITTAFPNYGGTVARNPNAATYNTGTTVTLTATAAPGYTFNGWSGTEAPTSSTLPTATVKMDKSKTLVTMFTPVAHTLAVNANPAEGGAVFVNGTALKEATHQNIGPEIVAWAMAADGYVFEKWSMAGTTVGTDNPATINITNSNMTLTANFRSESGGGPVTPPPVICALTTNVSPQGGGSVSRNPDGTTYRIGTRVTVTATPVAGYTFTGWSGASGSTDTIVTIMMDGNKTLTANFQQAGTPPPPPDSTKYAVIVSSAGTGAIGSGDYAAGATVTISAGTAPTGQVFKNWMTTSSGVIFADANNATTTFIMPGNAVMVTAVFEPQSVTPPDEGDRFTDSRDGKTYRMVTIGSQTWMAENLNYQTASGSWCYGNTDSSCVKYGRLYDWETAKTACPSGWYLPDDYESGYLRQSFGSITSNGTRLKATNGWNWDSENNRSGNGTDDYRFSALPGGRYSPGSSASGVCDGSDDFCDAGNRGNWWTASENGSDGGGFWFMRYNGETTGAGGASSRQGFSVRCLQDGSYTPICSLKSNISPVGGGSVSHSTNKPIYLPGTIIGVTATPASGYTFTGWSGASTSKDTSVIITMDGNKELTANFEIIDQSDTFTDSRDGKVYRMVKIGNQTWMAENLNYDPVVSTGSWCYDNADSNCVKYGRLYDWNTAMTVCPTGWKLPDMVDWNRLVEIAGGDIAGKTLKATNGWYLGNNGEDEYGFSAVPSGLRDPYGRFDHVGDTSIWWTATEYSSDKTYYRLICCGVDYVHVYDNDKSYGVSVRCVQND